MTGCVRQAIRDGSMRVPAQTCTPGPGRRHSTRARGGHHGRTSPRRHHRAGVRRWAPPSTDDQDRRDAPYWRCRTSSWRCCNGVEPERRRSRIAIRFPPRGRGLVVAEQPADQAARRGRGHAVDRSQPTHATSHGRHLGRAQRGGTTPQGRPGPPRPSVTARHYVADTGRVIDVRHTLDPIFA